MLGENFNGDYIESIKSLMKKKRNTSFNINPFKRSDSKLENSEEKDKKKTKTADELNVIRLQKELNHEKKLNFMNTQQLEGLKEAMRHIEFEHNKNSDNMIYKNLRSVVIEIIKNLPVS